VASIRRWKTRETAMKNPKNKICTKSPTTIILFPRLTFDWSFAVASRPPPMKKKVGQLCSFQLQIGLPTYLHSG
jgi:hypothetical protein